MTSRALHQDILREELSKRIARNSAYSLRAFSKSLAVDAAVISRVLTGSRTLSAKVAERICLRLNFPPEKSRLFIDSAAKTRLRSTGTSVDRPSLPQVEELSIDTFRIIADWYHYAILELTFTPDFKPTARWISKALGISASQASLALDRLLKLGLLEANGKTLRKTQKNITTANKNLSSAALRQHQSQILEKAQVSLENDDIANRSMNGMTMAIDPTKMPAAKAYIEEFMNNMCTLMEKGSKRRVYQLGVCLYPLQR